MRLFVFWRKLLMERFNVGGLQKRKRKSKYTRALLCTALEIFYFPDDLFSFDARHLFVSGSEKAPS
jgi:hypothetical protein